MFLNLDWPNFISVLLLLILLSVILFTVLVWFFNKSKISWLNWASLAIIFSFPFERIPSLDIFGLTLRLSQVFTLLALLIFITLLCKGALKNFIWSNINYWFLALILVTIPSIFFVENWPRWIVTMVATLIVFSAAFIIANFLESRKLALFGLIVILFVVGIFGYFQFFADLIGLPVGITLLKETYTKQVFGFARIHATAAEPLYFAGMLFLPIYAVLIFYLNSISKNSQKSISKLNLLLNNFTLNLKNFKALKLVQTIIIKFTWVGKVFSILEFILPKIYLVLFGKTASNFFLGLLIFFLGLFIITIAKSAWLAIFLTLPILIIFTWNIFDWKKLISQVISFSLLISPVIYFGYVLIQPFQNSLDKVIENFSETIIGVSSTSTERESFQSVAASLLKESSLIGIGSGQYGISSERTLRSLKTDNDQFFIVNNVYLEIWLELGIIFLIIFIAMWVWELFIGFTKVNWNYLKHNLNLGLSSELSSTKLRAILNTEQILHLSIMLSIISYLIQWFSFSPVYIMPIFILLGLLFNFNKSQIINFNKFKQDRKPLKT